VARACPLLRLALPLNEDWKVGALDQLPGDLDALSTEFARPGVEPVDPDHVTGVLCMHAGGIVALHFLWLLVVVLVLVGALAVSVGAAVARRWRPQRTIGGASR
jgi:hypothetical protein